MADDNATDNTSAEDQQTDDNSNENNSNENNSNANENETPSGAPESYADFELPDGMELNAEVMGEFTELAKGANLPQDKAQELVALGAKMAKGFETSSQQALGDLKASFATDLAKDPKLGGEGLDANLAIAQRGFDAYASKELKTMLEESGLNKHPELVRYFHAVGQTVAEDTNVDGATDTTGKKSLAERMYGTEQAA